MFTAQITNTPPPFSTEAVNSMGGATVFLLVGLDWARLIAKCIVHDARQDPETDEVEIDFEVMNPARRIGDAPPEPTDENAPPPEDTRLTAQETVTQMLRDSGGRIDVGYRKVVDNVTGEDGVERIGKIELLTISPSPTPAAPVDATQH